MAQDKQMTTEELDRSWWWERRADYNQTIGGEGES